MITFDKILNEAYNKLDDLSHEVEIKLNVISLKTQIKLARNYIIHSK